MPGGFSLPTEIEECIARLRVLLEEGKLQHDSEHSAQRIKSLLIAQLEEHNYHLLYNLHGRDSIVESIQKWQRAYEPGTHLHALGYVHILIDATHLIQMRPLCFRNLFINLTM